MDTSLFNVLDASTMLLALMSKLFASAFKAFAPSGLIAYLAIGLSSLNYVAIVINRPAIARNTTINMRSESEGVLTIAVDACPVANLICLTATHDGNRFIFGHREKDFMTERIFVQTEIDKISSLIEAEEEV